MDVLHSAVTGKYDIGGDIFKADCVIGHSFGTSIGSESPNAELAKMALGWAQLKSIPLMMDETLTMALPDDAPKPDVSVEGPVANAMGKGVGTWGTFLESKRFMDEQGLNNPILIAQAFHIGRVTIQALRLGMDPVILSCMPTKFDKESAQPWTRSRGLWIPREVIGLAVLKLQKRL